MNVQNIHADVKCGTILGKDNTMKIIRRGNPNKIKTYRITCTKCETIFSFDETEVLKECLSVQIPPNSYLTYKFVYCPICNLKAYV